jgi:hypothetical protein
MKKQPRFAGARVGTSLLSPAAGLSAAGMLVASAFLALGQTQLQPSQQRPESVVAIVAEG